MTYARGPVRRRQRVGGRFALLAFRPGVILPRAYRQVLKHRLRTFDAIHLAVAGEEGPALAGDLELAFVTRDDDQAAAARRLGFAVR